MLPNSILNVLFTKYNINALLTKLLFLVMLALKFYPLFLNIKLRN